MFDYNKLRRMAQIKLIYGTNTSVVYDFINISYQNRRVCHHSDNTLINWLYLLNIPTARRCIYNLIEIKMFI